ncbi:Vacuolar protein sorting-associated protein 3 [Spathaspora sp. JA1]|nr:Vacuolar protein sorting-associated protein 3 [Spathaspora sp. JA1]
METDDTKGLNYQISPFITNISSLVEDEFISTITTYESNVYIGTTKGIILHYHRFDDVPEYILISQLTISEQQQTITKILVLPMSKRVVILSGRIAQVYSLPELSPCHIKRMKDINDIELLHIEHQPDSILVLSPSKLRIVQFQGQQIRIIREIHYTNAITGDSFKSNLSNSSNLIVVADNSNYNIIDIENNRKIPLFEYGARQGEEEQVTPLLTSFYAQDTNQSELLLTISSDSSTSIAMFINTLGDVTRGTLTWIGQGYPNGGVVIEWPFVFGIFNSKLENSKLIVSSLETLDSAIDMNLDEFKQSEKMCERTTSTTEVKHFSIKKLPQALSIEDVSIKHLLTKKESVSGELIQPLERLSTDILIHNQKQIWSIHKTNPIIDIHNLFINCLESEKDFQEFVKLDISHNTQESKTYAIHLKFLAALYSKQPDLALTFAMKESLNGLVIDPALVSYLLVPGEPKPQSIFTGLESIIEKSDKDLELMKRYIIQLPSKYRTPELRRIYYTNSSESEILEFFDKDISFWDTYSDFNKSLIEIFTTRSLPNVVIKAYEVLFEHDENRTQIASLYSGILSENLTVDRVPTAIKLLSSNLLTEKDYGKLLLEVITIDKDVGVQFMKSKVAKRYNDINRTITKELSDSSKGFAILSIELLESSFLEDFENQELFNELLETISTTMVSLYSDDDTSFELFLKEYQEISSLDKDKWPKISWLDFIRIRAHDEALFELYLKSFELCWLDNERKKEFTLPDHKLFQYHKFIADPNIPDLLSFHDYSTAETVAITGELPLPKHKFYPITYHEPTKHTDTSALLSIFKYYLELYQSGERIEPAIQHFVETYTHIPAVELLELIPNSFPLAYLGKFLEGAIVDLKSTSRETHIEKVVTKSESSRIKQLYKDFLTV